MKKKLNLYNRLLLIFPFILMLLLSMNAVAQDKNPIVRLAKIQIYPAQLENYKAALKEGIETAVRVEPGVLTLYAVAEKDNPTHITVFEVYASDAAYRAHIETPHFKKYKSTTKDMVKSLELVENVPIILKTKDK